MAHIRDRHECLTGCQDSRPWSPKTDMQYDFIMVYGIDEGMPGRIREYREKGYVVHLMTGSAWGDYQDYLDGKWDGINHWDESQLDRHGKPILHGINVPYLCPTLSFCRYLTEKLLPAVDTGVEAIHLEEPEFWDEGGYSEGFKREYKDFYHEDWQPPHLSLESRHKAAHLKVYLYKRLVEYVSRELKQYAKQRYDRELKFYVPTHSLVNYTQWKILSPEGTLLDIPTVDGCIAQVWTGTSRVGNVYEGKYAERTFETAFLEYGVMQELVRGTGRRMWFLHDPVEDNPEFTWEDFKKNYLKTVIASLLHPDVHHYEVSPWPTRVMTGIYPKKGRFSFGLEPGQDMNGAKPIPPDYAELICAMTQTLGDMEQESRYELARPRMGIFMADSGLYQRTFPDNVPHSPIGVSGMNDRFIDLKMKLYAGEDIQEESRELFDKIASDEGWYNDYVTSGPFPHFFGMAMPLVKAGIPLRPVLLENVARYEDYLSDYDTLILSYEFMKPRSAAIHDALIKWVLHGGKLICVGDGSDPYHRIKAWWNEGDRHFDHPMQHLYASLGLPQNPAQGVYDAGKGQVAVYPLSPARITLSREASKQWVYFALDTAEEMCPEESLFLMRRGPYLIGALMEESARSDVGLHGHFADMLETGFPIIREKRMEPGGNALLYDLKTMAHEPMYIVGTSGRIFSLEDQGEKISLTCKAAADIAVHIRLKLPRPVTQIKAADEQGALDARMEWDEESSTVLITFQSTNSMTQITLI